ncbi:hypothetical protein GCM10011487_22310 [Steroidobacter agaridevorans]|uniref:Uncharacterized protein n=1 Tax=Steroidobacter agaridevorans TaxID=2695856 RepID=A0A829YBH1_9GAMM|nr:hypothetical protein GCM10011487_22310 [Steroidobacter agaridevorans]
MTWAYLSVRAPAGPVDRKRSWQMMVAPTYALVQNLSVGRHTVPIRLSVAKTAEPPPRTTERDQAAYSSVAL